MTARLDITDNPGPCIAPVPGTVALVTDADSTVRTMLLVGGVSPCWHGVDEEGTLRCLDAQQAGEVRPLVVIDPEDRDDVDRLCALYVARTDGLPWVDRSHMQRAVVLDDMQAALRGLDADLKPEVYAHLTVDKAGLKQSVCGKVWQPDPNVIVLGKCPDCLSIVNDEEWIA